MGLSSAAITEITVESGTKTLLREWLAAFFDGSAHAVSTTSGVSATFPTANITFDQSPSEQPLSSKNGLEIRVIIDPAGLETCNNAHQDGFQASHSVSISFWVIASPTATGGLGNANYLANNASQLLLAILSNPGARYDLALKGITAVRPTKSRTYSDNNYARRLVKARAVLRYPIVFS